MTCVFSLFCCAADDIRLSRRPFTVCVSAPHILFFLSFNINIALEMGPLTMGYERWANLAPEVHELQSFGYAEVSEDGSELAVKLMNIDGSVMFSKVLMSIVTIITTVFSI